MDRGGFYYDIFSTTILEDNCYEGTVHFDIRGLPYDKMMELASSEKLYPLLPYRENVRFIEQQSPEWFKIMKEFNLNESNKI